MSTIANRTGASGIAVDWVGELELTPIAEVIRRIVLEERSGDLRVTSPQAVKTIHFDRGFVVFASSNLKSESLGERLIASGRISQHEFALVSMLTKSSKHSFRQTLAHAGIVSEEELGRHVAAQVNEIVLSLFSAKEGTYNFEEGPCAIPLELMVSLSAHRILLEGIRRMGSGKLILSGLPPLDSLIRVVEAPPFSLDFGKLRPVERTVLRLAGTRVSIRRILATAGEDKGKVLRACYGLYGAGVLELAMSDAPRAPRRVQEETGTFVMSEILRKIGPRREIDADEAVDVSRERQEPERTPVSDKAPTFLDDVGAPPPVETATVTREEPVAPYVARTPASSKIDEENAQGALARAISFIAAMVEALRSVVSSACRGTGLLWNELRANARKTGSASEGPEPYSSTEASTTRIETREPLAGRAATPYSARRELQTVEEPSRKESVGIPSWSTLDDSNDTHVASSASYEPVWPEPEEQEPVLNRLGVPKWSSRDDPDEAPTPPVGMFEETSQEQESASEKLPPPSWSILDDPRRAVPKEKKESPAPAEPSEELVLHLEEESTTARAPEFSTPFTDPMDAPPSTGELFIELEPEEDGGASMLSPIPVEEVHIEEEQELLIVVDQDAFADLPETLEELARRPSTSPETVRTETKARQDADVLIPPKQERVVTPGKVVRGAERIGDAVESRPRVSIPRGGEAPPAHRSPERSSTPSPRRAPKAERSSESVPIRMDDGTSISDAGSHPHDISPRDSALPHPALGPRAPEAERPPQRVASRSPDRASHQESSGVAGTHHRAETPTKRSTEQGPEPDGDKEVDTAAHEERMHAQRMAQGGGEARILRDVKLHFKVRDWDGAVRLLHELIKIAPANSLYRGMLARAMSRHPTLRSDAEEHFHEALRLAPQDPEIHYWLGVYYLSFGLKSRAVTEFKTTLRIDPKHEPARKQLSASGQREDALGGVFKKLFG